MCCVKRKVFFMCSSSVEGLATNGIVHFNPEAYIRDGAAQYIAQENMELPFDRPLYATPFPPVYAVPVINPGQPRRDVYVRHEKHSSSWTGPIIGAVVGALAAYLGYEVFKDKDHVVGSPEVKPEVKATPKITVEKAKEKAKGLLGECKDGLVGAKDKFVGWVKGKKVESEVDKVISEAAKNPAKEQKGFFATRFYKTKIALGVAASLAVLYTVYKAFTGKSKKGE
jgi:hypothetical protein